MRVLQVCAEIFPLLKTGGLADVAGALPAALKRHGCDVRVLLPGFPAIKRGVAAQQHLPGQPALIRGQLPDSTVCYLIDAPELYEREGNPYSGPDGRAYEDNHRRFALLGRVACLLAEGHDTDWAPQIVHGHDWHAGLAPAYLKAAWRAHGRRVAASVHTVHNLAFQGTFGLQTLGELSLPADFYQQHGLEFHGQISYMKAGLHYADHITTVSPTYAREIQGEEQGCGLDGVLRARAADLSGILNGVDDQVWNPLRDPLISHRYGATRLAVKRQCRSALQQEFGLEAQTLAPVFGVVSRLTEQKGVNLILAGLPDLLARGGQLVVLGSGEPVLEDGLREAARVHPRSVAVHVGYDENLAHRIVAGADVLMVPSRFEPCGLTQLYGLAYGTLPLVRKVGGLADTVCDCSIENLDEGLATGIVFERFAADDYSAALRRAIALFKRGDEWRKVQRRAMAQPFGWDAAAAAYASLYRRLVQ